MSQQMVSANNSAADARARLCAMACVAFASPLLALASVVTAQTAAPKAHRPHKPDPAHVATASPSAPVEAAQPEPERPNWPMNDAPSHAAVTWNSQGLQIKASNSSLSQILNQVSSETGTKIQGLSGDERVFGDYGPGQAHDVLAQLLHGSGYDFLLVGDQGQGTPRQVILTPRQSGARSTPSQAGMNPQQMPDVQPDEDPTQEPEPDDQNPPQPQPFQPQQPAPQANPPEQMTPQQRMQLMQQQRLQQMQQMQQQYQQQQQNQPQQEPPQQDPPQ